MVQFLRPDGAWDWIAIKRGGLVLTGDLKIIRGALQSGKIRFVERVMTGDPNRTAMGQLLLELAGTQTAQDFASVHRNWTLMPVEPGDFPISKATRQLLSAADGRRTLRKLMQALELPESAVSEELQALHRLQLVHIQPPAAKRPRHRRLQARLVREQARLQSADVDAQLGLSEADPPQVRRVARWKQEHYARLSDNPRIPESIQDDAEEISGIWRAIFVRGGLSGEGGLPGEE